MTVKTPQSSGNRLNQVGKNDGVKRVLQEFIAMRLAGGFNFIMADPPWRFENYSKKGEQKNAIHHYDCAPLDWIKSLPVKVLAGDNCLLWLWATNPMLPDAINVLSEWGFEYKTAGTWVKRTKLGKDAFGTGYIFRSSNEPILIGTIGTPKTTRSTRSIIPTYDDASHSLADGGDWIKSSITIEGVTRLHSQKPEEAYVAAEGLMPGARRVELFSRTDRDGWSVWGDETGKIGGVECQKE